MFGNAAGRKISVYRDEYYAKYALSLNYIDSNFQEILVGSSLSDHFPVQATPGIYNASLYGANLADILPIIDSATRRGRIRAVYLCLDPGMTEKSSPSTALRIEDLTREAWGSLTLLKTYFYYLTGPPSCDPDGVHTPFRTRDWWTDLSTVQRMQDDTRNAVQGFSIDPMAWEQLVRLAVMCRDRKVAFVPFLAPRACRRYSRLKSSLMDYLQKVSEIPGIDRVYDLNAAAEIDPELQRLLDDRRSFADGKHFTAEVAGRLWPMIYTRIRVKDS